MWNLWCLNTSSIISWWHFECQGESKDWLWCSRSEGGCNPQPFPGLWLLMSMSQVDCWDRSDRQCSAGMSDCTGRARAGTIPGTEHRLWCQPGPALPLSCSCFQGIMPAKEASSAPALLHFWGCSQSRNSRGPSRVFSIFLLSFSGWQELRDRKSVV